jgi:hypothetical protein
LDWVAQLLHQLTLALVRNAHFFAFNPNLDQAADGINFSV